MISTRAQQVSFLWHTNKAQAVFLLLYTSRVVQLRYANNINIYQRSFERNTRTNPEEPTKTSRPHAQWKW